jgi:hypothetical protein
MSVFELLPGQTQCPYHFHHGNEEVLLVLRGRPTDELARYAIADTKVSPDVVEYPDSAKVAAMARTESQRGGRPIWTVDRLDHEVDFFDGEQPRA